MSQKVLLNSKEVSITLHRLACQLIENHDDFTDTVLIGLQPRGKYLANRLAKMLKEDYKIKNVEIGHLDITFFRDDFRRGEKPLEANTTEIDFIVEDNKLKLNKFIPGVKIPIKNKSQIKNKNNVLIVLAWNFYEDIKKNNSNLSNNFINIKELETNS